MTENDDLKAIQALHLKDMEASKKGDFKTLRSIISDDAVIIAPHKNPVQGKETHDKNFEAELSSTLKKIKNIFVFGCTTGLRYSDIFLLTNKNFDHASDGEWYLKLKSKKTKTYSYVKLPGYAVDIYKRHKSKNNKAPLFGKLSLFNFNKNIKQMGELAGFTTPVEVTREKQGKSKLISSRSTITNNRFCDKMSSHMMRRTAVTTLLILGMPEHLVRKISGHSSASNSFNRYVHYAQSYMDKEIEKVHSKLEVY